MNLRPTLPCRLGLSLARLHFAVGGSSPVPTHLLVLLQGGERLDMPEASAPTLVFPVAGLPGPTTNGVPFALSLQWVPFVLPSPQVASLPFSHSQRVRGLSFPSLFYSCGVHPKSLKLAL